MKYFLNTDTKQVHAFPTDGTQDDFITSSMILMNSEQVDRHLNQEKYMSEEEKYELYLKRLKPLERRQFKLMLLKNGLLTPLEEAINSIEDSAQKMRIQIEYTDSDSFDRLSEAVIFMLFDLLSLTKNQVDQMWNDGLNE
ncbi:hypothetical protein F971_01487 [Acinetobacter vivianii]|uniref:Uncharacterized protein n=1 Tax=Acinetobacter vivianii TaxID=1776742 RepID=N8UYP9_9GAMM|nr:hypothetical protein [Acinetobacter vivianii]ENU92505.1 hypothetical protein F971_01487 [Acinetobacter vivianii]